jgi:hypothetical protein
LLAGSFDRAGVTHEVCQVHVQGNDRAEARGYWLTSADKFLVEIAATLTARYRIDELNSGDVSTLITLLGKMGFSPNERGKMNLANNPTEKVSRSFSGR